MAASPWWTFSEKVRGGLLASGGIVTAIAVSFGSALWFVIGVAAPVVGLFVLCGGLLGQLIASLRGRNEPDAVTSASAVPDPVLVKVPQTQFASEGATGELSLVIDDEVWHPHQYKALIVEVKLKLTSHSHRVKRLGVLATQIPGDPEHPPDLVGFNVNDVRREVHGLQQRRAEFPCQIDPGESITFWSVRAFPWQWQGGEPEYSMVLDDGTGHEHGVRRFATPK